AHSFPEQSLCRNRADAGLSGRLGLVNKKAGLMQMHGPASGQETEPAAKPAWEMVRALIVFEPTLGAILKDCENETQEWALRARAALSTMPGVRPFRAAMAEAMSERSMPRSLSWAGSRSSRPRRAVRRARLAFTWAIQ